MVLQQDTGLLLDQPVDPGSGKRGSQVRQGGKRVDHVPDRTQLDDQDSIHRSFFPVEGGGPWGWDQSLQQAAGGMVLWVSGNGDPSPVGEHHLSLGDRLLAVVGSLAVYVGLQPAKHPFHVQFLKDQHVVHARQGGQDFRPFLLGHQGAGRPLERAHGGVRIDGHHQAVSQLPRLPQVADVAHVEPVKASVGQHYLAAALLQVCHQRLQGLQGEDLGAIHSGPCPPPP